MAHDPAIALETLISLGFERLLTSGSDSSALEGLPTIRRLVEQVDVQCPNNFFVLYCILYMDSAQKF